MTETKTELSLTSLERHTADFEMIANGAFATASSVSSGALATVAGSGSGFGAVATVSDGTGAATVSGSPLAICDGSGFGAGFKSAGGVSTFGSSATGLAGSVAVSPPVLSAGAGEAWSRWIHGMIGALRCVGHGAGRRRIGGLCRRHFHYGCRGFLPRLRLRGRLAWYRR